MLQQQISLNAFLKNNKIPQFIKFNEYANLYPLEKKKWRVWTDFLGNYISYNDGRIRLKSCPEDFNYKKIKGVTIIAIATPFFNPKQNLT